jgi:hypothetical protein
LCCNLIIFSLDVVFLVTGGRYPAYGPVWKKNKIKNFGGKNPMVLSKRGIGLA